ncbi:hypothetical protein BDN71DRAFT_1434647 [Pleurotus eryngii]|uniref:Uncharacterized protein n=1 Tax=Pleurotus eryngii TaxID=5323 RepID=A0A9P5ZLJ2_PLEER|nr:hypothetical protein BDN71DRAFT_1434647 [Pleurotus eryngii]
MAKSATSAKPKTGKQKKARGQKSWAKGSKLEFLESFKEEYLATADMRGLYTKITTQFIDKYGYDLPHDEDASDTPPIIVNLASLPYDEQETEQERRDEIYDSLQLKIGNWLHHKYKRKQTDQDMVSELLNTMSRLAAVRPRRRNAMNIYWAENYASSIKKLFDAHWKKVKNTVPAELRMSMCADFVRAKYEDETEEFRKALEAHHATPTSQLPPTGGAATATAVPQPVATQSVFMMPTPPPFFGPFGATLSGDITMPLPLPSSTPSPGVASTATTMSPSLPASGSPPPPPLPDSSLVQPTQNDKENLTPPGTGEKHPLDQEPEDSLKRTCRQSKLPSHLEDAGYVAPSKGKRKSTVKPAAKPMPTKRASKKK